MVIKIRWLLVLIIVFIAAAGCSTKNIRQAPACELTTVSERVKLKISGNGPGVDGELLRELEKYAKAKLIIAGFDINGGKGALCLAIHVKAYSPGSAVARNLVGFGAGRGSLIYDAAWTSSDGKVLAEMEGKERFTGLEPGFNSKYGAFATLKGADTVKVVLIQEAAEHSVNLASKKIIDKETAEQKIPAENF